MLLWLQAGWRSAALAAVEGKTLLGGLWILGGVGVAGVGVEVAMTRTILVAEANLTTMQGVAQVHFLLPCCMFVSLIGDQSV